MITNFKFTKIWKGAILISIVFILLGAWYAIGPTSLNKLGFFSPKGFNFSIDFKGGTHHQLMIYSGLSIEDMRDIASECGLGSDIQEVIVSPSKRIGDAVSYIIKSTITKEDQALLDNDPELTSSDLIAERITKLYAMIKERTQEQFIIEGDYIQEIKSIYPDGIPGIIESLSTDQRIVLDNVYKEGESVISVSYSKELFVQSIFLIVFVLVIMLIYVTFRFKFNFALGAIIALIHDTLFVLGIISITGIEFNYSVVAAILTLIGYSINDTIVIYDRIRENSTLMKEYHIADIINSSINQTLSRTIITSLTTFLAVFALYIWGGQSINNFSFVFMIGIIVGTYSSIFIASPIVMALDAIINKNKKNKPLKRVDDNNNSKSVSSDENNTDNNNNDDSSDIVLSKQKLKKIAGNIKKK